MTLSKRIFPTLFVLLLAACLQQPPIGTPGNAAIPTKHPTLETTEFLPTITVQPTPTLQVSAPEDRCIAITSNPPTGIKIKDTIVMMDWSKSALVLKSVNEIHIPEQPSLDDNVSLPSTSPNGQYLSYRQNYQDEYILVIRQSDGTIFQRFPWIHMGKTFDRSFDYSSYWVNSKSILFRANYSSIKLFLVAIDTGEAQELSTDFPRLASGEDINWGIDDHAIGIHYFQGANVVYDPSLTRVVYPKTGGIATLYDIQNKKELATLLLQDASLPTWSPDGKFFAIKAKTNADQPGDELFIVPRDGPQFTPLTSLASLYPDVALGGYSWSPNNQQIAFWFKTQEKPAADALNAYTLALLDVSTRKTTNLCLNGIAENSTRTNPRPVLYAANPIWSPDGTQLLTTQEKPDKKQFDVILVDLANQTAYKIAQNLEPVGWMTKGP